ncbi:MAG: hypothetical protein KBB54_04400 [Candidatus Pacebacteria bacterium]|nr:hypothetical protein [Candidatus Paceibacterota bacterium]MBP9818536.1 hypothetical protein [Candidatus Paceibacterota bacterium]
MPKETFVEGIFVGSESPVGKEFAKLSPEDQQLIADALAEITHDGPGVCDIVPEDGVNAFVQHLRNYMSVEGEDPTGLRNDAAMAVKRMLMLE